MSNELLIQSMKRMYKNISKSRILICHRKEKQGEIISSIFSVSVLVGRFCVVAHKCHQTRGIKVPDITMNKKTMNEKAFSTAVYFPLVTPIGVLLYMYAFSSQARANAHDSHAGREFARAVYKKNYPQKIFWTACKDYSLFSKAIFTLVEKKAIFQNSLFLTGKVNGDEKNDLIYKRKLKSVMKNIWWNSESQPNLTE